jgi:hypothetical protein
MGSVGPDQNTKPPTILTLSPENNTAYGVNTLSLSLNVSIGDSTTASSCFLDVIYCKTDWQSNITFVYKHGDNYVYPYPSKITEFSGAVNFTEIPDGNHTIKVYAFENGKYPLYVRNSFSDLKVVEHCYNSFQIIGSSLIKFAVDTTAPKISILALENRNFTSIVPLNFTTDERIFQSSYSLDGQDNVTIAGNTTLTDLIEGEHKVTVFATDEVGNTGASETIAFTIEEPPEPFPTTLMATASGASVAIIGAGMLVYFEKRKH